MHATQPQGGSCPEPHTSPILGLPMTDADRRRKALRDAGYTGWVDPDGYARTDAEFAAWSAFMSKARLGWFPADGGGYVLTNAGREALAKADTASQFAMSQALANGVSPEQLATGNGDGEPSFEWLSDQDTDDADDDADTDGERQPDTCLDQREAADAAGPIEQEAPGTAARVLRSAAVYLERHGWTQGAYYDPSATVFTPAADMAGAIGMVCYGGPVEAPAQHFDDPGFLDFEEAMLHLDRFLLVENGTQSYEFNDAKGRRKEDVIRVLREAAARPAQELIDDLQFIITQDAVKAAEVAELAKLLVPCGIWGDDMADQTGPLVHAGYPHAQGALWDCPACESDCYCSDGVQCVHCVLQAEQNPTDELIPGERYTCTECFTEFVYDDVRGPLCDCADPLPSGNPDGGDAR